MSTVEAAPDVMEVDLPSSPYPGLRPFEKREWMLYFGREVITDEIIGKLIEQRCVTLHGSSGSGKSSLIRAGVLPRLEQEHARRGFGWRTSAMVPGSNPMRRLAEALAGWHPSGPTFEATLAIRRVLNRGREAATELSAVLRRAPEEQSCLLVDQFEEVFELAKVDRDQAALFTDVVVGLAETPPEGFYTVLTMRSDYLGACARFAGLAEAVNRTQYLLPRMTHADLVRAIREPAELYGGSVARDLAERLISEGRGEQDELPLIQHALMLLWREAARTTPGQPTRVTMADYAARTSVSALLSGHADTVLASVAPGDASRRTAELLFRALTDINAEGQAVRQRRTFADLCAITGAEPEPLGRIIDPFRVDGVSFLRPYAPEPLGPDTEIDISHEALIRCWAQIADPKTGWLHQEFRDGLIWRSLLVAAESFEADGTNVLGPVATDERERWLARRNAAWAVRYGGGWDRVTRLMSASRAARDAQRARDEEARQREADDRLRAQEREADDRLRAQEREADKRLRAQELQAAQALIEEQRRRANSERRTRQVMTVALVVAIALMGLVGVLGWNQARALKAERAAHTAEAVAREAERKARELQSVAAQSTKPLLAEFGWSRETLTQAAADPHAVRQSIYANQAIQEAMPAAERDRRRTVTVEYFPKNVDANKVEAALADLGFSVKKPQALVQDTATNSVWFGTPVRCEDVKLVALTLIRAGVVVRSISHVPEYLPQKKDLPLIQIGASKWVVNDPPLTVDAIRALARPCEMHVARPS